MKGEKLSLHLSTTGPTEPLMNLTIFSKWEFTEFYYTPYSYCGITSYLQTGKDVLGSI